MVNEDLHKYQERIIDSLGDVVSRLIEIKSEITKLRETLSEGITTITDAIHENTEAQSELHLMEHMADVRAIPPQIEAEQEQIEVEREELDDQLNTIEERYQERHRELNDRAAERIRDLGEHIFEIDEEEFETGIEDRYVDQIPNTWPELRQHNHELRDERVEAIQETLSDATDSIDTFLQRRQDLIRRIDRHRTNGTVEIDEREELHIPFWEVTIERDGKRERVIVPPSYLRGDTESDWLDLSLDPIEGFADKRSKIRRRSAPTDRKTTLGTDELVTAVDERSGSGPLGLISYQNTAREAVENGVEIDIETDDDDNDEEIGRFNR